MSMSLYLLSLAVKYSISYSAVVNNGRKSPRLQIQISHYMILELRSLVSLLYESSDDILNLNTDK